MVQMNLAEILAQNTREGELYKKLADGRVQCHACAHRCVVDREKPGICRVRFNRDGKLLVPYGYVSGLQADPIEKKPFFHVLPGSRALSLGMRGCDFHCSFCQNWVTTQTLRDPEAVGGIMKIDPEKIAKVALDTGCRSVISTYNEPLITSEWALAIFKAAKVQGLVTGYVSNGNATPEVLDYLRPHLDLYKVDLKGFDESRYRELGGKLENVCQSIRGIYERGFWLEIVTLLVPGFNDSAEELKKLAEFIASVSPGIPWHVTAFHPDYQMTDRRGTPPESLLKAVEIGRKAGLRYVYAGNLPGQIEGGESTYCPHCRELLVERLGYQVVRDRLSEKRGQTGAGGVCFNCKTGIPGMWSR
jgi:pyruvate formate lyase activating enzyme